MRRHTGMTARRSAALLLVIGLLVTAYRLWVIRHLGIDLYVDKAYYWGWSKALDWGYFSKPRSSRRSLPPRPRHSGDGILAVKLPALFSIRRHHWYWRRWAPRLFDARIGFCGLAGPHHARLWARSACSSPPTHRCCSSGRSLLFLLLALEHQRWRDWLGLGLAVGLGLSKYTMAAFPPALLVMLMLPRGRRALVKSTAVARAASGARRLRPNLWWNWQNDFPTLPHRRHHPCR